MEIEVRAFVFAIDPFPPLSYRYVIAFLELFSYHDRNMKPNTMFMTYVTTDINNNIIINNNINIFTIILQR
jgi:hypothetical protein